MYRINHMVYLILHLSPWALVCLSPQCLASSFVRLTYSAAVAGAVVVELLRLPRDEQARSLAALLRAAPYRKAKRPALCG